jgi:hypothetical protein
MPHCFGAGVSVSGRSDRSPDDMAMMMLATTKTGNTLFLRNDKPPPMAQPVAPPPIMGSSRAPALTGPYKLTI